MPSFLKEMQDQSLNRIKTIHTYSECIVEPSRDYTPKMTFRPGNWKENIGGPPHVKMTKNERENMEIK